MRINNPNILRRTFIPPALLGLLLYGTLHFYNLAGRSDKHPALPQISDLSQGDQDLPTFGILLDKPNRDLMTAIPISPDWPDLPGLFVNLAQKNPDLIIYRVENSNLNNDWEQMLVAAPKSKPPEEIVASAGEVLSIIQGDIETSKLTDPESSAEFQLPGFGTGEDPILITSASGEIITVNARTFDSNVGALITEALSHFNTVRAQKGLSPLPELRVVYKGQERLLDPATAEILAIEGNLFVQQIVSSLTLDAGAKPYLVLCTGSLAKGLGTTTTDSTTDIDFAVLYLDEESYQKAVLYLADPSKQRQIFADLPSGIILDFLGADINFMLMTPTSQLANLMLNFKLLARLIVG